MQEIRKLRELRDADRKNILLLKETRDKLRLEYNQRINQLDLTELELLRAIEVWDKLIERISYES